MPLLLTLLQTFTPSVRFGNIPASTDLSSTAQGGQLLTTYIREGYTFGIGVGAFLAVVMVMWGGFLYITASGISSQAEKGKEAIKMAFLGLVLLMTSYIMLQTINPALIALKFPDIPGIPKRGSVPDLSKLPSSITAPDRGVAPGNGACLVRSNPSVTTELYCIDNVTQSSCRAFGSNGPSNTWYQGLSCSNPAVQNVGTRSTTEYSKGRCVIPYINSQECYDDVPGPLCLPPSQWTSGARCNQVAALVGACWEPLTPTSFWTCAPKTRADCLQTVGRLNTPLAVWCGAAIPCVAQQSVKAECPAK